MTPTSTPTRRLSQEKKAKECENDNTNRIHKEMWHRIHQYKTLMAPSLAKTFFYHRESTMSCRNTKVKPSSSWSKKNNKSIFRANIWVSLFQISRKKPRNYIHFEIGFFKSFCNWASGFYLRHGNKTTVRYNMHKTTKQTFDRDSARWKAEANKLLDNFLLI